MKRIGVCILLLTVSMQAQQVVVVSIDSMAHNDSVDIKELGPFVKKTLTTHPWLVWYAPWNFTKLYNNGKDLSKKASGMTNIVGPMIRDIGKEKGADLDEYIPDIVRISVKPKPVSCLVDLVRKLKQTDSHIVGVARHDREHHAIYTKKLKEQHDIDLDKLFTLRLTVPIVTKDLDSYKDIPYVPVNDLPNTYAVTHEVRSSFDAEYFKKLRELIHDRIQKYAKIIYIDTHENNLDNAKNEGFETIRIEKPERDGKKISLHAATEEEIACSMQNLKEKLAKYNLVCE